MWTKLENIRPSGQSGFLTYGPSPIGPAGKSGFDIWTMLNNLVSEHPGVNGLLAVGPVPAVKCPLVLSLVQFKPAQLISDALLRGRADQPRADGSFYGLIRFWGLFADKPDPNHPLLVKSQPATPTCNQTNYSISRLQVLPHLYRIAQSSHISKRKTEKSFGKYQNRWKKIRNRKWINHRQFP